MEHSVANYVQISFNKHVLRPGKVRNTGENRPSLRGKPQGGFPRKKDGGARRNSQGFKRGFGIS